MSLTRKKNNLNTVLYYVEIQFAIHFFLKKKKFDFMNI